MLDRVSAVAPHGTLVRGRASVPRVRLLACGTAGVLLCSCVVVHVCTNRSISLIGLINGRTIMGDAGLESSRLGVRAARRISRLDDSSSPLLEASPQAAHLGKERAGPSGSQQGEMPGHWSGVGSENYGTPLWDNTGWNAHYHPRDGASMDSESMEPWYWRKGPRVNDEYTGHMADGDPLFSPPDGWEPPIDYHDSTYLPHDDGVPPSMVATSGEEDAH